MKTALIRNTAVVLVLLTAFSNAFAVDHCEIDVWAVDGSSKTLLYDDWYSRGEDIGGKTVTSLKDCTVCFQGGQNEGPALCNAFGGDEYEVTCEKNGGGIKKRTYECP